MLVYPSDAKWDDPPIAVEAFRREVADRLSEGWQVELEVFEDNAPESVDFVSAVLVATFGQVRVEISRHGGGNVVYVQFDSSDLVPFEDLAVVKGELDRELLLQRASCGNAEDAAAHEPLVPFDQILDLLHSWAPELDSISSRECRKLATRLQRIGDEVTDKLFSSES